MKPGPPPKPTLVKAAEGDRSKVGRKKLEQKAASEPKPVRGFPERPKHLAGDARAMWDALTEQLAFMDLDYSVDAFGVECACVAFATYRKAQRKLDRQGLTFLTGNSYPQQRPEVSIAKAGREEFMKWAAHFGLSPAARSRIMADAAGGSADDDADVEARLSKPRNRTA